MTTTNPNIRSKLLVAACGALLSLGAAAAATAAPAAATDPPKMDSQQPVSDTWITTKVKAELATTADVDAMDVSVDTVNGTVYLTGNVDSDIERKKAIASAKSVKGVEKVDASGLKTKA